MILLHLLLLFSKITQYDYADILRVVQLQLIVEDRKCSKTPALVADHNKLLKQSL